MEEPDANAELDASANTEAEAEIEGEGAFVGGKISSSMIDVLVVFEPPLAFARMSFTTL